MKHAAIDVHEVAEMLFWSKVVLGGRDECWLWTGAKSNRSYGRFGVAGKNRRASRIAWALHHGRDPGPLHVCHTCDNPMCVNPHHLFLGTDLDNSNDKCSKGRQHIPVGEFGEANPASKLTADKVKEIRRLCASGLSQSKVAAMFGVEQTNVGLICRRKTWANV